MPRNSWANGHLYDKVELTNMNVCFNLGSSSSRTSAGSRRMNFPSAINPNACDAALAKGSNTGSARKARKLLCIVVSP